MKEGSNKDKIHVIVLLKKQAKLRAHHQNSQLWRAMISTPWLLLCTLHKKETIHTKSTLPKPIDSLIQCPSSLSCVLLLKLSSTTPNGSSAIKALLSWRRLVQKFDFNMEYSSLMIDCNTTQHACVSHNYEKLKIVAIFVLDSPWLLLYYLRVQK